MKGTTLKRIVQILVVLIIIVGVFRISGIYNRDSEDSIPTILNKEDGNTSISSLDILTNSENLYLDSKEKSKDENTEFNSEDDSPIPETNEDIQTNTFDSNSNKQYEQYIESIGEYKGISYIELNNNIPLFSDEEKTKYDIECYSELDNLGRCGVAFACISKDTMPTEERGAIGMIKPSGWHTVKYNDLIEGNYLYNRCHLIGYQLAGENDNERNLITGTRYLNVEGMLPFETSVVGYVNDTHNHVLYRVTPIFKGDNLVASGVTIEAFSIEDAGKGICFYVYIFNVQPGIIIDYKDGESKRDPNYQVNSPEEQYSIEDSDEKDKEEYPEGTYILNTNTHKFHYPSCKSVSEMAEKNKKVSNSTREELIEQGYSPCKRCNP